LRDRCAIVGIGNTAYTRGTDKSTAQLHLEASLYAITDAGMAASDIDGIMPSDVAGVCAEELMVNLGLSDLSFSAVVRTGGASFVASILDACLAIEARVAHAVLLVGGRRGYSQQRISRGTALRSGTQTMTMPAALASVAEFERPYGSLSPGQMYAQAAQRHMYEYGTTSEQFGKVAVACRKHANLNPQALMFGRPMTLEDHQSSRLITTPFHLLDCSLESDGAGAIVITSAERARALARTPVLISGVGEGHGNPPTSITQKRKMAFIEGVATAGQRAYQMAGIGPGDIDCAQLHDPFTWLVVGELEALQFCPVGEGGPFVEEGRIELGADLPVNTHGGLLSEAHVSGVNHVIEAVRQLRREVEPERQVPDCETALVNNEGDMHEGSVVILRRGS
jgi:acetyl-CoA acetyltransferase